MKLIAEVTWYDYCPWDEAEDVFNRICNADKLDELEEIVDELTGYEEYITTESLNDLLCYHGNYILKRLGMKTMAQLEAEREEREERVGLIKELTTTDDPDIFCSIWQLDLGMDCKDCCPLYDTDDCENPKVMRERRTEICDAARKLMKEIEEEEEDD